LIDLETHQAVFTGMLQRLADAGLVKGKTAGIRTGIGHRDADARRLGAH
jgi:hypothetical protein